MAVADIITSQQIYATNAIASADTFLTGLLALSQQPVAEITSLPNPEYLNRDNSQLSKQLLLSLQPASPTIPSITGDLPTYTEPTIDSVPDVPVPDFSRSPPSINIPTPPSTALPSVPSAPSVSNPVLPTSPDVNLPVSPTVEDILVPEVPVIAVPAFTSTSPIDDLVAPTTNFQFYEETYESALLDELNAKLLSDLQNGSYGIEPADEDALYNRTRDRETEAASVDMDSLISDHAGRGFPIPSGELNVALQRARQALTGKISSVNRDIMIKRNDQFVQARQFAITSSKDLEQVLIGFHSSIMERSLNAAKETLRAGIALFDATVAQFNARQEAYRTDAQVFEAKIRASLSQVEIYRTQMEGKKLESELQRNKVDTYRAQLDGIGLVVALYKSQLEAASVQSDVERTRIEAFRSLVTAYVSQVQAKAAEFSMYDSQIKGELSKAEVYKAEADAYQSIVAGSKTKSDILIAKTKSQIDEASQGVEAFKARVEAYRADLQGQTATVNAEVASYGSDISGYNAAVGALAESYRLSSNAQALEDNVNARNKDIAIENARLRFQSLQASLATRVDSSGHASSYYAALASGAVNAINALSTLSE